MSEFTGWGRKHDIDFGDYIKYPTGYSRDMHIYKVVGALCSNTYQDVPAVIGSKNRIHDNGMVPVLNVIHCGVDEREVIRVRESDCIPINSPDNPPLTREELLQMDGELIWIDAEAETPDIGQSVLIYLPDEDADQICVGEYLGEGNYRIGQKIHRGCEIGAWMPAPKPPKEEGEKPVDLQAEEIKKEKKWKEYEDDALRTSLAKAIPLDRLAEIVDAELGHRLIVLPNNAFIKKAGETLYLLDEGDIVEVMHCGAEIEPDGKISAVVIADDKIFPWREPDAEHDLSPTDWCTDKKTITPDDIGKTVFYTREHAERAQKGDV